MANPTLFAPNIGGVINHANPINPLTYSEYGAADDCRVPVLHSIGQNTNPNQAIQLAPIGNFSPI
jgi:hypothetical protein